MKTLRTIILLGILILANTIHAKPAGGKAQKLDSLKSFLVKSKEDTLKLDCYYRLGNILTSTSAEEAQNYIWEGLDLSEKLNEEIFEGRLSLLLANHYSNHEQFDSSNYYYRKSYEAFKQIKDTSRIIGTLADFGTTQTRRAEYQNAIKSFKSGMSYALTINDTDNVAYLNEKIAMVENYRGDLVNSATHYLKAIELYALLGDKPSEGRAYANFAQVKSGLGQTKEALKLIQKAYMAFSKNMTPNVEIVLFNNMGYLFEVLGQNDSAIFYFEKSKSIVEKVGNERMYSTVIYNIANLMIITNELDKAEAYLNESFEIKDKLKDKAGLCGVHIGMAKLAYTKENFVQCKSNASIALDLAKEIESLSKQKSAHKFLFLSNRGLKKYKEALEQHISFIAIKDSISGEENTKLVLKKELQYEFDKQKIIDDKETAVRLAVAETEKKKQNVITFAILGGLILVVIFSLFILSRLKLTRKQKIKIEHTHRELEEKNNEILDSITYAKRIQSAILPSNSFVKEYLKESFILYKPKDVVAGDFYWMEPVAETGSKKEPLVLFAAADCTGHGVPGAMVSVVCNNALNRSVREHGLIDPGEILTKTREIVIQEFEKSEEEVKDGMDIALCSLEGMKLQYAGAHNPLWIIRNGELIETKANKQPIGQFDNPEPYTTHSFDLEIGDSLYLFSDGYVDQFGGEKGKKFKTNAFRELLLSIQSKSMEEQKIIINDSFETWKGTLEQIDDVCVIGVKV